MAKTTITKPWNRRPIEVGERWVRKFAGCTAREWPRDKATLQEVLDAIRSSKGDPVLSLGSYETKAVREGTSGVYFQRYVPVVDPDDGDLTRNLKAIATVVQ